MENGREKLPTAWNAVGEEFKKLIRSETTSFPSICCSSLAMAAVEISVDRFEPSINMEVSYEFGANAYYQSGANIKTQRFIPRRNRKGEKMRCVLTRE